MIVNDLQRLRWQILDEALRDPVMEYFMGERTKTNETGNTRSLIHHVNQRLRAVNRTYSCSKRNLQNDVALFQQKGARLEPRFRRGHKRILRYLNLEWKNPLLRPARSLMQEAAESPQTISMPALTSSTSEELCAITLRVSGPADHLLSMLGNPAVLQRQADGENAAETITLQLPLNEACKAMLLGLGTMAEVLAPESLREEFRQTSQALQKIYRKASSASQPKNSGQQSLFGELF
ncbi:MAG: WYL domain-containing protein [Bacteroidaceae bacterium]|nr:WYL domain-containing protein [Bacteroidaceae bacterium]